MKLFLLAASALLLASPAMGANPMISRMRSDSIITDQNRPPYQLPDWVNERFPKIDDVLWYTKNTLAETQGKSIVRAITLICDIATFTGFLKPSYVPAENQLTLGLYAPNSVSEYSLNNVGRLVNDSDFSKEKNVTIFFSGSQHSENDPKDVVSILAKAYLSRGTHNFIVVNVGDFVDSVYKWAVLDSRQTGNLIGEAVAELVKSVPAEKVHLIGHGLGAHIAGIVGRYVQHVTGQQIARITALDPSRICHAEQYGAYSLQRGDAAFVDVIHSNNGGLGISEPIGDADFYPNGQVTLQPGCYTVSCASNRAVRYYADSVRDGSENNYMAVQCTSLKDMHNNRCLSSKIPMGLNTPSDARGNYYLETSSHPPYGKGDEGDILDY